MRVLEDSKLFGYVAWTAIGSFSVLTLGLAYKLYRIAETLVAASAV